MTACTAMQTVGEKKLGKSTTVSIARMERKINMEDIHFKFSTEDFHFMYSNSERTYIGEDGEKRTYKVCDACRAEEPSNFGMEVSFARRGACGVERMGLCTKCANKILPILEDALEEMHRIEDKIQEVNQHGCF